ncbi:MAG: ATP-binding cassette domain-containing protein [Actinomycetota bacterium]
MLAIHAQGLTKAYEGRTAVTGFDLEVDAGEVVALLGPNGTGKTTTIMMLLGIVERDVGDVRLLGHPLPHERGAALARANFNASYVSLPDRLRCARPSKSSAAKLGWSRNVMPLLASPLRPLK